MLKYLKENMFIVRWTRVYTFRSFVQNCIKRGWWNVGRCNVIKASTSRCLLLQEEVL